MPSQHAAVFCTDKTTLEDQVKQILDKKLSNVSDGKKWYEIVVGKNPTQASLAIWDTINQCINK
ncbi:hypothetical protein D3C85_1814560 [compost metagenome]